jgi:preprotein translocase subunit SecG
MFLVTGLLTVLLVIDCLFLILLVLIQLPKKEAGAGLAFGGGATDALFGAGSGNALTKITKYATIAFFVLLMIISLVQSAGRSDKSFERAIEQQNKQLPTALPPGSPAATPAAAPGSNAAPVQLQPPPAVPKPAPATDATNAAPK